MLFRLVGFSCFYLDLKWWLLWVDLLSSGAILQPHLLAVVRRFRILRWRLAALQCLLRFLWSWQSSRGIGGVFLVFLATRSFLINSHHVNWSVGKTKQETKRESKNYHGVADLAHIEHMKTKIFWTECLLTAGLSTSTNLNYYQQGYLHEVIPLRHQLLLSSRSRQYQFFWNDQRQSIERYVGMIADHSSKCTSVQLTSSDVILKTADIFYQNVVSN